MVGYPRVPGRAFDIEFGIIDETRCAAVRNDYRQGCIYTGKMRDGAKPADPLCTPRMSFSPLPAKRCLPSPNRQERARAVRTHHHVGLHPPAADAVGVQAQFAVPELVPSQQVRDAELVLFDVLRLGKALTEVRRIEIVRTPIYTSYIE